MSLTHWSLKNWRNLRESAKSPVRERKISSHNVTLYMKHSLLVCDRRKLLPQSKNGSCRWYRLAIRNDSREMILSRGTHRCTHWATKYRTAINAADKTSAAIANFVKVCTAPRRILGRIIGSQSPSAQESLNYQTRMELGLCLSHCGAIRKACRNRRWHTG